MKPDRRLRLRREAMTPLDPDGLRAVAAGVPGTISKGPGECLLERLLREPTVDVNTCPTLLC